MSDNAHAIQALEARIGAKPDDAAPRYQVALLLLDECSRTSNQTLMDRAREQLERAMELDPSHAPSHAALGYIYDSMGVAERALDCFREARLLDPRHREYQVYAITLLVDLDREEDALAEIADAARRHKVDLVALRRDLTNAAFPADARTLLVNGFIAARSFFKSSLREEAERILNTLDRDRKRRVTADEMEGCTKAQRELARSFNASKLPDPLRPLAAWALRYGVGDDVCRPLLLNRLPKKQKAELIHDVDEHAEEISAWLDSFPSGEMSSEASAFLFLLEGIEEIRE